MKAAFSQIDITPPLGTSKIGWIKNIVPTRIADPLFARAAILESKGERLAFIQLDTLMVPTKIVQAVRKKVAEQWKFAPEKISFSATHNHGGPALATMGVVDEDKAYVADLIRKLVEMFGQAITNLKDAEVGFGRTVNLKMTFNRRVVTRSGLVKTHLKWNDPEALYHEGPVDPELLVLAVRHAGKKELMGSLIGYTSHPTHHGGDECFSAGWPGVLSREMMKHGSPMTVFMNGALGNVCTKDDRNFGPDTPMQTVGESLAEDVAKLLPTIQFKSDVKLGASSIMVELPYRDPTEAEIKGTVPGAQRFIDSKLYDQILPSVVADIKANGTEQAELQAFFVDDHVFAFIPGELFVELGLKIKLDVTPLRGWIVGLSNGWVGYIPTKDAFKRGGYETTFNRSSKLAPEAGDLIVSQMVEMIRKYRG